MTNGQLRTLLSPDKQDVIRRLAGTLKVPGDIAELGVYRGGISRLLSIACPDRLVHLFDTFTGIPWDGYDPTRDRHKPGEFVGGFDEVCDYLADRPNVRFHPGLFPGTAIDGTFALVHLDADLYASTKAGLEWFWPRLSAGGCVVLDDYRWHYCPGVEQACKEFFGADATLSVEAPYQLVARKK